MTDATGGARIGPSPTLLQVEQEAFRALRDAQDKPCIEMMKRAVDTWRVYEAALRHAFPPRGRA